MQVRYFIHMKILLTNSENLTIDLNTIYRDWAISFIHFTWNSASTQADNTGSMYLTGRKRWIVEIGSDHKIIPWAMCKHLIRIIDGMNSKSFIQQQLHFPTATYHANIVVE